MSGGFPQLGSPQVKICGVTSATQAEQIAALGADAIGLNFWARSKRYLCPPEAAGWAPTLRQAVTVVGVFVNATDDELKAVVDAGLVDVLQLHGDETADRVAEVMGLGLPVIKAIQVQDAAALRQIAAHPTSLILLDSYNPVHYGGEGKAFPWELAADAVRQFADRRIILAGGLTPQNVAEAIRGTCAQAVDVASGVERSPGDKDLEKVAAFIHAVRTAV
jgi:phosphoribosylanthranilate isomerase